ncbi:MAG: DUF3037 domain-containing protein [Propionibacteriaceae bacterium]|nr:DUF3037 domain-containing protein [Propionibacteriaceae bacterium]
MSTYFTVMHCVPDPAADERMNIGIVVFAGDRIQARFLGQWDRLRCFAGSNTVNYVRAYVQRFEDATETTDRGESQSSLFSAKSSEHVDERRLRRMVEESSGIIQFSPIQLSLQDASTLLEDLSSMFLIQSIPRSRVGRDRHHVTSLATESLELALTKRFDALNAKHLLKSPFKLGGKIVHEYRLNGGIKNARAYEAFESFSFEVSDADRLEREVNYSLLAFQDIRQLNRDVRFDVVTFQPKTGIESVAKMDEIYDSAKRAASRAGVNWIVEEHAAAWADEVVALIPDSAAIRSPVQHSVMT